MSRTEAVPVIEPVAVTPDPALVLRSDDRLKAVASVVDRIVCPNCRSAVDWNATGLVCVGCGVGFPAIDGIVDLRPASHTERETFQEWDEHWQADHQSNLIIRLCSVYRTAIFSWSIGYFVNRYFPKQGLFLEAGSGTSETSVRIDKHNGQRILIAVDVVRGALERSHPCMSGRMCGDIFQLPFRDNSVDGIWNVGVMEHFTYGAIDQVLAEFHRVLKPGARIILLWPGRDSLPQKLLHLFTKTIRLIRRQKSFQLHPAEISQLKSLDQGREFLARAGFKTIAADGGMRALMACKTLVGEK